MQDNDPKLVDESSPATPVVASSPVRSKPTQPKSPVASNTRDLSPGHTARERLLAMAIRYRAEGQVREAMEMFWELAESYAEYQQGTTAKLLLLEMASSYERTGSPRLARSIYERILDDED
jgi:hypothetical protein